MLAFIAVALCLGLHTSDPAGAQSYPSKPIKVIVPGGPGGPTDVPARLAAQILPPTFGQPVVIEHRPGAGGVIGTREVAKAPPDGHTLLSGGSAMLSVIPGLSANVGYDPAKDFAPIAKVMESFQILVVHPSSPWRSVKQLVQEAKVNPGKLNYAHVGAGHITHLTGELLMLRTGVNIVGIPYRGGGEQVTALLSQSVHMLFSDVTILLPLIREGKLRALAVTSKTRRPSTPDIPTMMEAGIPDYEALSFFGIVAPAGTPVSIVNRINTTLNEALKTAEIGETITRLGAVPQTGSPEEFAATIATHLEKWRALGRTANIRID